jgi:phosphonate transport system substrate-binding protein
VHRLLALVLLVASGCDRGRYREVEVALTPAPPAASSVPPGAARALRFSVAAVESPRDTYASYSRLIGRLGERLGVSVELVQRRTYREVNDLLTAGQLDAALICTGGYLDLRRRAPGSVEVLAVPVVNGARTYEAVIVVPSASSARTVADLAGKRFAFTDELSFSGNAYVRRLIADMHRDPDRFFGTVTFTHSHDRSIAAVERGLADGATIHGGIWARFTRSDPELARRLRVLHRSPPFGAMPVVAATALSPQLRERIRRELLGLDDDPEGAAALAALGIDRFDVVTPGLYDSAERVVEGLE